MTGFTRVFSLKLVLVGALAQLSTASPTLVSASASSYFSLSVPCSDTQSASGPSQASASSACTGGGNHSEATSAAGFQTLLSNSLTINASSTNTTGGNIYTDSTADWSTWLVVRGGSGSGFLNLFFSSGGIVSAAPGQYTCEVLTGALPAQSCTSFGGSTAFTFDQPFAYATQLHVQTIADTPEMPIASVYWSISVQSVQIVDGQGSVIQGATVEVVPEPASVAMVTAGLLLCVIRKVSFPAFEVW